MAVRSYLAHATHASARAEKVLNEVKRVYPNMPLTGELHTKQGNLIFNTMSGNTCIDKKMRQMIHEPSDRVSYAYAVLVSISSRYESKNSWRDVKEDFTAGATIVRNIIELATSYSST
jgi:hypothetical protein